MKLYFFINYLVRRYINFNIKNFIEWSKHLDDSHNFLIVNYNNDIIESDNQLIREFSCILLSHEPNKSINRKIMFSELLHISHCLDILIKNDVKIQVNHLRYLLILYYHYMLDNPISMLLDDLKLDYTFFKSDIKRLLRKLT